MTSLELLIEIEAWLSFNTEPSREETAKLRKSIKEHVSEQLSQHDVISRFLYEMATKHNVSIDDIIIGIEEIHPRRDDGKIKLQVMNLDFNLLEEFLSENSL